MNSFCLNRSSQGQKYHHFQSHLKPRFISLSMRCFQEHMLSEYPQKWLILKQHMQIASSCQAKIANPTLKMHCKDVASSMISNKRGKTGVMIFLKCSDPGHRTLARCYSSCRKVSKRHKSVLYVTSKTALREAPGELYI